MSWQLFEFFINNHDSITESELVAHGSNFRIKQGAKRKNELMIDKRITD
ncbi:10423_t:CDS:2 [Funneliformis caledonium]|uniref:10423_t:CDS:1 n=1 Tax=Funneliformis caledonium TaxID=1117310 RepID=A0A9N8ZQI2_9GLOM|nr:10423_t:CDS:2 [Funneliformis caledonium]